MCAKPSRPTFLGALIALLHRDVPANPIRTTTLGLDLSLGDVDERGGFRNRGVAFWRRNEHRPSAAPVRMHTDEISYDLRRATTDGVAVRMERNAAAARWNDLAKSVREAKMTVEQERVD